MSRADEIFKQNCRDILDHGVWDTELEVRPHWDDGTPAHTVKKFGHRQRTQFINAHGGVVIFRRALYFLSRVAPRRVGVNDGVFFDSYSPFPPPATASRACSMRWAAMV